MRKFILAAATTAALALGMGAATAPANAQIYFGLGAPGFGYPGYYHHGYGYYGDGYGFRHRGWRRDCGFVTVRRHHHWVNVRRCGPGY